MNYKMNCVSPDNPEERCHALPRTIQQQLSKILLVGPEIIQKRGAMPSPEISSDNYPSLGFLDIPKERCHALPSECPAMPFIPMLEIHTLNSS
jgi:hypothetical protein